MNCIKRKRLIIIKSKHELKRNDYEIKGNVVLLKLAKRDGTIIDCKIDPMDLTMVLDKGIWFAEWSKKFNNYLAKAIITTNIDGKNIQVKQDLHSVILGSHPKAPIRHFNGDTLDNRRSNIEVYDKNSINDYKELDSETISIILRDAYGRENAQSIIDKDDLEKVIKSGHSWVCHKSEGHSYAVANSPEGRIHLEDYIMSTPEDNVIKHIDYNTLNNKKSNLNIVVKVKKQEDDIDTEN